MKFVHYLWHTGYRMDSGMNVYNVLYLFVQWKEDLWPIFSFYQQVHCICRDTEKGQNVFIVQSTAPKKHPLVYGTKHLLDPKGRICCCCHCSCYRWCAFKSTVHMKHNLRPERFCFLISFRCIITIGESPYGFWLWVYWLITFVNCMKI